MLFIIVSRGFQTFHTHVLTSSSFIHNLCRSLDDPIALAFCTPAKPQPHRQHQDLPMASDVTRLYEPSAAINSLWVSEHKKTNTSKIFLRGTLLVGTSSNTFSTQHPWNKFMPSHPYAYDGCISKAKKQLKYEWQRERQGQRWLKSQDKGETRGFLVISSLWTSCSYELLRWEPRGSLHFDLGCERWLLLMKYSLPSTLSLYSS